MDNVQIDTLGQLIKYYRKQKKNMTQKRFSQYIGVNIRTLQAWEADKKIPREKMIDVIFGKNPDYVVMGHELRKASLSSRPLMNFIQKLTSQRCEFEDFSIVDPSRKISECIGISKCIETPVYKSGVPQKILSKSCRIDAENYSFNNIIVGAPGSGKNYCYINNNINLPHTNNIVVSVDADTINHMPKNTILWNIKESNYYYDPIENLTDERSVHEFASLIVKEGTYDFFSESAIRNILIFAIKKIESQGKKSFRELRDFFTLQSYDEIKELLEESDNASLLRQTDSVLKSILIYIEILFSEFENYISQDSKAHIHPLDFCQNINSLLIKMNTTDANNICQSVLIRAFLLQIINERVKMDSKQPLPYLSFVLDECSSLGEIPGLDKFFVIGKNYKMSFDLVFQSVEQLEALYPNTFKILLGCANILLLGTANYKDCLFFEELARESILLRDMNKTKPKQVLCFDDIIKLNLKDCIVFLSGRQPFIDKKICEKHF